MLSAVEPKEPSAAENPKEPSAAENLNCWSPLPQRPLMTSQGTAHGRFQRAIERRSLFHAELAAREMEHLNLADALALALLIAESDPDRWPRAAARWHARFVQEARGIGIDDAGLALEALRLLPGPHRALAAQTLRGLAWSYGLDGLVQSLAKVAS